MRTREFGARVSEDEYLRFRRLFPQQGATKWFINTALEAFNRRLDELPELADAVDLAVERMAEDTLAARREDRDYI